MAGSSTKGYRRVPIPPIDNPFFATPVPNSDGDFESVGFILNPFGPPIDPGVTQINLTESDTDANSDSQGNDALSSTHDDGPDGDGFFDNVTPTGGGGGGSQSDPGNGDDTTQSDPGNGDDTTQSDPGNGDDTTQSDPGNGDDTNNDPENDGDTDTDTGLGFDTGNTHGDGGDSGDSDDQVFGGGGDINNTHFDGGDTSDSDVNSASPGADSNSVDGRDHYKQDSDGLSVEATDQQTYDGHDAHVKKTARTDGDHDGLLNADGLGGDWKHAKQDGDNGGGLDNNGLFDDGGDKSTGWHKPDPTADHDNDGPENGIWRNDQGKGDVNDIKNDSDAEGLGCSAVDVIKNMPSSGLMAYAGIQSAIGALFAIPPTIFLLTLLGPMKYLKILEGVLGALEALAEATGTSIAAINILEGTLLSVGVHADPAGAILHATQEAIDSLRETASEIDRQNHIAAYKSIASTKGCLPAKCAKVYASFGDGVSIPSCQDGSDDHHMTQLAGHFGGGIIPVSAMQTSIIGSPTLAIPNLNRLGSASDPFSNPFSFAIP